MEPRRDPPSEETIASGLRAIVEPDVVFEVRPLRVCRPGGTFEATWSGYFDDVDAAARAILAVDGLARGVYATLNPVDPTLLARSTNRMRQIRNGDPTTKDHEILRRARLLIDADPVRPAGISSTSLEHNAAIDRCRQIHGELIRLGTPEMLLVDSGNGGQLIGAIDLPTDDGGLVKRVLAGFSFRFSDDTVVVDTGVFNSARIVKIPGTLTRKGDDVPERPHRRAQILDRPDELLPIDRDLLEVIASWAPRPSPRSAAARNGERLDLEAWLSRHGVETRKPRLWNGGTIVDIRCPVAEEHGFDAWVGQDSAGMLSAGCFHSTCTMKSWASLRDRFDGPRSRPARAAAAARPTADPEEDFSPFHEGVDTSDFVQPDVCPDDPVAPSLSANLPLPRFDRELSLTDDGNAHRFVRDWGGQARYVHGMGWHLWRGTHWSPDTTELVVEMARLTASRILLEAGVARTHGATQREEETLANWAKRSRSAAAVTSMLILARSDNSAGIAVTPSKLDADSWLLNVENGTIDLRTGESREHRRDDLLTHCVPLPYDRDALCPRWEQFLLEVFNQDVALAAWIQSALGYSLTGETGEQCFFLLYGKGSNGKTTFLEISRELLGGKDEAGGRRSLAIAVAFETLLATDTRKGGGGPSEDLARMAGRRMAIANEPDAGRRLNEEKIKILTGGDTVTARFMFKSFFEFRPVAKLWLACNQRPSIRGTDHGIWRRVKLVPFTQTFPKHSGLLDELRAELPGILRFAVDGCRQWRLDGLGETPTVTKATDDYRADSDILGEFLDERCVVSAAAWVSSADLYVAYKRWSEERGETPLTQRMLGMRLEDRPGMLRDRKPGARGWKGIGLRAFEESFGHDA